MIRWTRTHTRTELCIQIFNYSVYHTFVHLYQMSLYRAAVYTGTNSKKVIEILKKGVEIKLIME